MTDGRGEKFLEVFTCFLAGLGDHGRHGKGPRQDGQERAGDQLTFHARPMVISGIINLVKAATHPSKHPGGHELLASFPPLL